MTQQEWDAYEYHRKRGCKRKANAAVLLLAAGYTMARLLWIRAQRPSR